VFNLSGSEIIFLIVIALVVLGPDKLPEAMRKAGKAYGDFKRMTSGFQNEMKSVLDEPMRELRETADLAKKSAMFDTSALTKPLSGLMADVKSMGSGASPPLKTPEQTPVTTPEPVVTQTPASVEPAAEFVAEPVVAPASTTPDVVPAITPERAVPDATSRRLARMQQLSTADGDATSSTTDGDATSSTASNSSGPVQGAPVE
jgi:sec-independent protein translocase protein TatB